MYTINRILLVCCDKIICYVTNVIDKNKKNGYKTNVHIKSGMFYNRNHRLFSKRHITFK